MKYFLFPLLFLLPLVSTGQSKGESIFNTTCVACHTIGNGALVGPDLKGIEQRQSKDWIKSFIKSPQAVFNKGDKNAITLFKNANGVVMPDQNLSDAEIDQVLTFITGNDSSVATQPATNAVVANDKMAEPNPAVVKTDDQASVLSNTWLWMTMVVTIVLLGTIFVLVKVIRTLSHLQSRHDEVLSKLKAHENKKSSS